MSRKYRRYLYYTLTIIFIIVVIPLTVNYLMLIRTRIAVENSNDWISFYGSFLGALIGAVTLFLVTYKERLEFRRESELVNENHQQRFDSDFEQRNQHFDKNIIFQKEQINNSLEFQKEQNFNLLYLQNKPILLVTNIKKIFISEIDKTDFVKDIYLITNMEYTYIIDAIRKTSDYGDISAYAIKIQNHSNNPIIINISDIHVHLSAGDEHYNDEYNLDLKIDEDISLNKDETIYLVIDNYEMINRDFMSDGVGTSFIENFTIILNELKFNYRDIMGNYISYSKRIYVSEVIPSGLEHQVDETIIRKANGF